ncbi:EBDP4, emopamil-binding protein [Lineolata rhizophorae]|uniref:EBDP4, emopamil-binding protein n=1 Tax=Lineolata rhizophorae TaxID=578093 RepID=A0A6A6PDD7_9PEZI|nr:EBDP4, emopamil-binding protein [Lineolata rhizophorae]
MAATINSTVMDVVQHPYWPVGAEINGYLANTMGVPQLLATFAGGCAVIIAVTSAIVKGVRPGMPLSELSTTLWFAICGCIHFFFEGYYSYNYKRMGGSMDLFGQLWKEYSLSDSRYLTPDSFVWPMETITAVCWGPLSFTVAWMIIKDHPMRHPLQAIVSLGQLYGDVLYYGTSMFDKFAFGVSYCRPEGYYFWGYYFFLNLFWIVIPLSLLISSVRASARAFKALHKMEKTLNASSAAKKTI